MMQVFLAEKNNESVFIQNEGNRHEKGKKTEDDGKAQFFDVLQSTMNSKENKKCFKDIEVKQHMSVKNSLTDELRPEDKNKDQSKDEKSDILLTCFAQVFGVTVDELKAFMDSENISVADLEGISDKITPEKESVLFNDLDAEQKVIFAEILDKIRTLVNSINAKAQPVVEAEDPSAAQGEGKDRSQAIPTAVVQINTDLHMNERLAKIMIKLKLKIDASKDGQKRISNAIYVDTEETLPAAESLADSESLPKRIYIQQKAVVKVSETSEKSLIPQKDEANTKEVKLTAKLSKNDEAASEEIKIIAPEKTAIEPKTEANQNMQNNPVLLAADSFVKNLEVIAKDSAQPSNPIEVKNVINQIIVKARVVLTGEKAEMVMDLKPDNLGKLSLKVVTENGIVMAKFIADNQQVKQVLETNMQTLKDSLEKQGLNAQSFSVSLRQDMHGGYKRQNEWEGGRHSSNGKAVLGVNRGYSGSEAAGMLRHVERYHMGGSTINLTA